MMPWHYEASTSSRSGPQLLEFNLNVWNVFRLYLYGLNSSSWAFPPRLYGASFWRRHHPPRWVFGCLPSLPTHPPTCCCVFLPNRMGHHHSWFIPSIWLKGGCTPTGLTWKQIKDIIQIIILSIALFVCGWGVCRSWLIWSHGCSHLSGWMPKMWHCSRRKKIMSISFCWGRGSPGYSDRYIQHACNICEWMRSTTTI